MGPEDFSARLGSAWDNWWQFPGCLRQCRDSVLSFAPDSYPDESQLQSDLLYGLGRQELGPGEFLAIHGICPYIYHLILVLWDRGRGARTGLSLIHI